MRDKLWPGVLAWAAVVLGTVLITLQYRHDGQVFDESAHIACGMEWLTRHTYLHEALHPPLARAATAVLPALASDQAPDTSTMLHEGNGVLHAHGQYWRNLTLARLGVLPFFWFACLLVYRLAAARLGRWVGATATALLALCPLVLAHSGLATTDAPLMAMYLASLLCFLRLLERPSVGTALAAGVVFALALLTKFTQLPFYLLAAGGLFLLVSLARHKLAAPARLLVLGAATVPLVVWAGYWFSVGPVFPPGSLPAQAQQKIDHLSPAKHKLLTATPVPAPAFFRGVALAKVMGTSGKLAFLMGRPYVGGQPLFFPVGILVKTPLPMLLFMAAGVGFALRDKRLRREPVVWLLLLGAVAPVLVGMASHINIGMRHILPSYPFFALLAALGAVRLWGARGDRAVTVRRVAVAALLAWTVEGSVHAAPDFLTYFNELAGRRPEYFLVNSDYDWGQGLPALETSLRALHVPSVALAYYGDPEADLSGLPPHTQLQAGDRPHGWVAVSESIMEQAPDQTHWLSDYPYTEVDKTIRLYHLP